MRSVVLACLIGLSLSGSASAQFGGWVEHPERWGKGPMIPKKKTNTSSFSVMSYATLVNRTGGTINFTVDGQRQQLQAGQSRRFVTGSNSRNTRNVNVSFDNGKRQTSSVSVGTGQFGFKWNNGVLVVFRE